MKKRTLLFKIWKFPQLSETFILNQVVLAIKMGYEVKILVGELTDISRNSNRVLFEKYRLSEKIIIEDYKIPHQRSTRILKACCLLMKNASLLPHLIKYYIVSEKKGILPIYEFFFYKHHRNFDLIHIQFGTNKHPVDIMKTAGYLKSKVIVSFHGHDLNFPINNRIPNNGYYDRLFEVADYLVANTPYLEEKLLNLSAPLRKIMVIPVTVDTNIFKPGKKENDKHKIKLITVGRLDELKGQEFGIRAVNQLIQQNFSLEYTIAGTGVNEEDLRNLIMSLGLTGNVFLRGKINPSDVSMLLQNSDIFLMTSVTNSDGMQESQGLVAAEAQACGLPIVAFDSGGVKYTIEEGETGFLCKEKDIACYSEKIEILIKNEKLRKKMGINAREFVERVFSENSVINKWKEIYH